jgi:hypothetical protein
MVAAAIAVLLTSCDRTHVGRFVIYETPNPANSDHPLVMKLDTKTGDVFWLNRLGIMQTDAEGFSTQQPLVNSKGDPIAYPYWEKMATNRVEANFNAPPR